MSGIQGVLTGSPISRQSSPYKGRKSKQNLAYGGSPETDPNFMMLQEGTGQVQNAEHMIQKEREYEQAQKKLYEEFKELDINQDGSITLQEIIEFLKRKQKSQEVDTALAQEIFDQIDQEGSGKVSLAEFVEAYFEAQKEVEERIEELTYIIQDDTKKKQEIITKLGEIQETEQVNSYGIMVGSVLTVTVIEGRDMQSSKLAGEPNIYVVMQVEDQKCQTEPMNEAQPVWNEVSSFDIVTGREQLLVQAYDRSGIGRDQMIGEAEITLESFRDQYKHEEWIILEDNQQQNTGKLKMNIHWIHSRKKFLQDILRIQDMAIEDEQNEKKDLEIQLKKMKQPFGFVQSAYVVENIMGNSSTNDQSERLERAKEKMYETERNAEKRFDEYAQVVAGKMGVRDIPWLKLTFNLTLLYSVVTCFVLFYRADFFDLTICVAALYMLLNTDRITQNTFRWLVAMVFFSLFYDLFWFGAKKQEYEYEQHDGGMEKNLRLFSLNMSYVSFFLRLIIALVYWKDSLDFETIILQKSTSSRQVDTSPRRNSNNNQAYIRGGSPINNRKNLGAFGQ